MSSNIETPQEMVAKFKGKALNANVIIRQVSNENVSEGGLDMTMVVDKNENIKKGIVISVGAECPKGDGEIKPGDTVMYNSYKDSDLTLEGIGYKMVFYGDLIHCL